MILKMNKVPLKNTGFSLLEILISLVIMSVGMMGLAGLKLVAIKGTNEAHFRHEASLLMADLADRMRANEEAVDNGTYELSTAVDLSTAPSPDCSSKACTADELAKYDQYQIALKMSVAMPGSSLLITCPNNTCSTIADVKVEHTIAINWKEKKDKSENMITVVDDETIESEFNDRRITLKITP
ncbi:MAG TPA: type IV pilus modification protein PilV [Leucothrix sp.]|nr:type IV pilus modification protein PilV [Leucothrix sp.]